MSRLYVVETMPTVTGFKAEHRLALKPSEIASFAIALVNGAAPQGVSGDAQKFFSALLGDLKAAGGKCVVIPGEQASPAVHAAAYALDSALGAGGKTVIYTETGNPMPDEAAAGLRSLGSG